MTEKIDQDLAENEVCGGVWRRRWKRLALIWGIWTFIGLVFTLQSYFTSFRSEKPTPFFDSLYVQMTWSYLWALATPLVLCAAARLPIERNNWMRSAMLHVPFSIVLSVVLTAIGHVVLWFYWGWSLGRPFSFERMARFVVANFSEGIGIYLLIALTSYAVDYYRRFRESQVKTLMLEAQLSRAQLQALKMQLHPHFLFNTLNTISGLMREDVEAADLTLSKLAELLRLTLETADLQEIPLGRELQFIDAYLTIQRARYGERLRVRLDVSQEASRALVPTLLLQPLVENAVRHGIAERPGPGSLVLEARVEAGRLQIAIGNDGPPLSSPAREGFGLRNLRSRLQQLHGAGATFSLSPRPEGGAVARLDLPAREQPAP